MGLAQPGVDQPCRGKSDDRLGQARIERLLMEELIKMNDELKVHQPAGQKLHVQPARRFLVGGHFAPHLHDIRPELRLIAALRQCRSEEHTSELQSLMRISYAVFCLKKKKKYKNNNTSMFH